MAQEKKLTKTQNEPDPEMLKKIKVLKNFEMLQMMRDLKLVEPNAPPKTGKEEK